MRTPVRAVIIAVCATVVGGCGGSGGSPGSAESAPPVKEQMQAAANQSDDAVESHRKSVEKYLIGCMGERGHQYVPRPSAPPAEKSLGLTEEQFRRQYGWGITTLLDYRPETQVDPNMTRLQTQPEESRKAYRDAELQCRSAAARTLGPEPGTIRIPGNEKDVVGELSARAEADRRVTEAKHQYAGCVAKHGFKATSGEGLSGPIATAVRPYQERFSGRAAELLRQGEDISRLKVTEVLNAQELDELRRLQARELTTAWVDFECGKVLYPVVAAVHKEYTDRYLKGDLKL